MEHPFVKQADLKELSLEQLQEKMETLSKNLTFAYRTGNTTLIHQVQMLLESYRTQQKVRMDELFEKQNIRNKISIESDKSA
jgi:hypothetical protein